MGFRKCEWQGGTSNSGGRIRYRITVPIYFVKLFQIIRVVWLNELFDNEEKMQSGGVD